MVWPASNRGSKMGAFGGRRFRRRFGGVDGLDGLGGLARFAMLGRNA